MNAATPLAIVVAVVAGTVIFAWINARRVRMSAQEFIVGGRGFGAVFLWVLLAGEIYTTFTFLGAAGWAYGFGAPAFYIMAYGTCGYVLGYFLLPAIWRFGKERGLLTSPDFFTARYGSKPLATLVAVVQCVGIVPYVTLQLSGLQIFLTIAGYGLIDAQLGAVVSFAIVIAFIFATGLRGTAWASIVKDALVIGALLFVGIAIPVHFFGSPSRMFDQLLRAHPQMLSLQSATGVHGTVWYVTTVLLTGIGYYMGPHSIAAVYSAKDAGALRRNAAFLPVYQLLLLLVFFAGFSALLVSPGLKGIAADQSFLVLVQRFYPAWVLGFIAASGSLCALVPASAMLLSAGSIVAKNIVGDVFGKALDDRSRVMTTRAMVVALGLLALGLWLIFKATLVELLLLYYNGVTQFAPAFIFGFLWRRTTALAVALGIACGLALALYLAASNVAPYGINAGFLGLALNVAIVVVVSLLRPSPAAENVFENVGWAD
ncbi:MAG: sodium:solute symporter family protein [Candidatus Eremiobacteraeota bacterium]|nr:sodium:solute symporter family protein [Candidatus Eremiobacteraeota bacterium]